MTTFDDLDALLSGDEPAWDDEPEAPAGADQANGYLRSLGRLQRQLDDVKELANSERARVDLWESVETGKLQSRMRWLRQALALYHQSLLTENPARKSLSLPNGTLRVRAMPDAYDFTPEFLEWAQVSAPELVRQKPPPPPEVDKAAAKRRLVVAGYSGGRALVVTPEGESVPGVTVTKQPPKFTAEPDRYAAVAEKPDDKAEEVVE